MVMASWHGIDIHSTKYYKNVNLGLQFSQFTLPKFSLSPFPSFETGGGLKFHLIMEDIFQNNDIRYVYYYIV